MNLAQLKNSQGNTLKKIRKAKKTVDGLRGKVREIYKLFKKGGPIAKANAKLGTAWADAALVAATAAFPGRFPRLKRNVANVRGNVLFPIQTDIGLLSSGMSLLSDKLTRIEKSVSNLKIPSTASEAEMKAFQWEIDQALGVVESQLASVQQVLIAFSGTLGKLKNYATPLQEAYRSIFHPLKQVVHSTLKWDVTAKTKLGLAKKVGRKWRTLSGSQKAFLWTMILLQNKRKNPKKKIIRKFLRLTKKLSNLTANLPAKLRKISQDIPPQLEQLNSNLQQVRNDLQKMGKAVSKIPTFEESQVAVPEAALSGTIWGFPRWSTVESPEKGMTKLLPLLAVGLVTLGALKER
tara:strand:- start:221 stop:1270 length:1050 start_codon:yes stop_codon:yes gene_type:complete